MVKKHRKITKAVIAAAGFGTRFLPATKNQPKEMLPIIDKPIIHYQVEEAVKSGITDIILVTRFGSHIMEDYFDNRYELEAQLEAAGKTDRLEMVKKIPQMANFVYVRQKSHQPYGNGSPLITVKDLIDDDEAFVYMFGDDMVLPYDNPPATKQLMDIYEAEKPSAILAVQETPWEEIARYGTVEYKENPKHPYEIKRGVEKLPADEAPSNMAQFGRFIFSYDVIEKAIETPTGKDNELWLIDILNGLAQDGKTVLAPPVKGEWLTTGDPLRYLKTTLKFAMAREDLGEDIRNFIREELGICKEIFDK
jgi:UTP--glucose-1-phosphate uridylyltransferase